jgi:hypothetical protein
MPEHFSKKGTHTEREFCRIKKKPRKGEKNKRHKKDAQKISLFFVVFARCCIY